MRYFVACMAISLVMADTDTEICLPLSYVLTSRLTAWRRKETVSMSVGVPLLHVINPQQTHLKQSLYCIKPSRV